MAESIRLSEASNETIEKLRRILRIRERPALVRMALAKGLSQDKLLAGPEGDSKGPEIPMSVIVKGEDEKLFDALIAEASGQPLDPKDKRRLYKVLIDQGFSSIADELAREGESAEYLLKLVPNTAPERKGSKGKVVLNLGLRGDGSAIKLFWNNHLHNQHLGVVGTTGAGKTQFVLELLAQIHEATNGRVGIIFLDYAKGDVAGNSAFTRTIDADIVDLAAQPAPVNPFAGISERDDKQRSFYVEAFVDIVDAIENIGPKQRSNLVEAIHKAFSAHPPYPDFSIIRECLEELYKTEGLKDDTVTEVLRRLTDFQLFPTVNDDVPDRLFDKRMVLDFHRLKALKELTAFIVLYKLYDELSQLDDSMVDKEQATRQIRTIIVIDEAHNYLRYRNRTLERMLRELRSKGVAIILLSQSLNDFDQKDFDFGELLNWMFVMKGTAKPHSLSKALGIPTEKAATWAPRVANFPGGQVLSRPLSSESEPEMFSAKMFWARENPDPA